LFRLDNHDAARVKAPSLTSGIGCDLERYETAFRENEIDDMVLPNLTAEDLKDTAASWSTPSLRCRRDRKLHQPRQNPPLSQLSQERRYLTVMFCDLVDSTGIAARLDAEEWRDREHLSRRRLGRDDGDGRLCG
jgi:hypothetical protein